MNKNKGEWQNKKVVVIGAGIAGLSAGYFLRKLGVDVLLLEREVSTGGCVRTALKDERYIVEYGPNAFSVNDETTNRIIRELSLEPLLVAAGEGSSERFIFRNGKMCSVPTGRGAFLRSPLVSFGGKVRAMMEPFAKKKPAGDESLANFVARRVGKEVLDAIINPFVSGIFAGDSRELEAESAMPEIVEAAAQNKNVISGLKDVAASNAKDCLESFRWGMGTLSARIEELLGQRIRTGAPVEKIERRKIGGFRVRIEGQCLSVDADAVLIAAPAFATARILSSLDGELSSLLSSIAYAPVIVVHLAFDEAKVPKKPKGFGAFVAPCADVKLLGAVWPSLVFPKRCPSGKILFTSFLGGALGQDIVDLSDEEITREALKGLGAMFGIESRPEFLSMKRWSRGLPQYTVGYTNRALLIKNHVEKIPGVFLSGNYLGGIRISDVISRSRTEVNRLLAYLKTI